MKNIHLLLEKCSEILTYIDLWTRKRVSMFTSLVIVQNGNQSISFSKIYNYSIENFDKKLEFSSFSNFIDQFNDVMGRTYIDVTTERNIRINLDPNLEQKINTPGDLIRLISVEILMNTVPELKAINNQINQTEFSLQLLELFGDFDEMDVNVGSVKGLSSNLSTKSNEFDLNDNQLDKGDFEYELDESDFFDDLSLTEDDVDFELIIEDGNESEKVELSDTRDKNSLSRDFRKNELSSLKYIQNSLVYDTTPLVDKELLNSRSNITPFLKTIHSFIESTGKHSNSFNEIISVYLSYIYYYCEVLDYKEVSRLHHALISVGDLKLKSGQEVYWSKILIPWLKLMTKLDMEDEIRQTIVKIDSMIRRGDIINMMSVHDLILIYMEYAKALVEIDEMRAIKLWKKLPTYTDYVIQNNNQEMRNYDQFNVSEQTAMIITSIGDYLGNLYHLLSPSKCLAQFPRILKQFIPMIADDHKISLYFADGFKRILFLSHDMVVAEQEAAKIFDMLQKVLDLNPNEEVTPVMMVDMNPLKSIYSTLQMAYDLTTDNDVDDQLKERICHSTLSLSLVNQLQVMFLFNSDIPANEKYKEKIKSSVANSLMNILEPLQGKKTLNRADIEQINTLTHYISMMFNDLDFYEGKEEIELLIMAINMFPNCLTKLDLLAVLAKHYSIRNYNLDDILELMKEELGNENNYIRISSQTPNTFMYLPIITAKYFFSLTIHYDDMLDKFDDILEIMKLPLSITHDGDISLFSKTVQQKLERERTELEKSGLRRMTMTDNQVYLSLRTTREIILNITQAKQYLADKFFMRANEYI